MGITRRSFGAVLGGTAVTLVVSGCGNGYDDDSEDIVIRRNHPLGSEHLPFNIAQVDVLDSAQNNQPRTSLVLHIQGNGTHGHDIALSAQNILDLLSGRAVTVTALASVVEQDGDHTHEVLINRFHTN